MKRNETIQNDEAGYIFSFSKQRAHALGLTNVTAVVNEIKRRQKEAHSAAQVQWARLKHITEQFQFTPQERLELAAWEAGWVGEPHFEEWVKGKLAELNQLYAKYEELVQESARERP